MVKMYSLAVLPLVIGMSLANGVSDGHFHSDLADADTYALRRVAYHEADEDNAINTDKGDLAAHFKFGYELFQMGNYSVVVAKYVRAYSLLYRVDIELSNLIHYKNGLFGWGTGDSPTYIQLLTIDSDIKTNDAPNHCFQSPVSSVNPHIPYRMLTNNYSAKDSTEQDLIGYFQHLEGGFESAVQIDSLCYRYDTSDLPYNVARRQASDYELQQCYVTSRLNSMIDGNEAINGNEAKMKKEFHFGYRGKETMNPDNQDLDYPSELDTHFAGPDKGGGNFRFTIFGVMNFQTDSDPSSAKISATLSVNGGGGWIHDWSGSQKREYTIL